MEKHNITLNCKGKCPKCDNGELLPFLRAVSTKGTMFGGGRDTSFDHYEVVYRCSNCNYSVELDSYL